MFNLITINLNYSCSFMYPVNMFQTSIKNFIVLIQGNWTIKKNFNRKLFHAKSPNSKKCIKIK